MPYANNIRIELYDDNLNAFVGQPNSVATETFLVVGADLTLDENSAQALVQYLKTRFAVLCIVCLKRASVQRVKLIALSPYRILQCSLI